MIPSVKIAEVRERADLVEVIGEHVQLTRAGANHKGVCPFHADSDPSFNVSGPRQFYHCFGCGVSGDVISFIQRIDGLSFYDAVERLAGKYGVELPRNEMTPEARSAEDRRRAATTRRVMILEEATCFFENQLWAPAGQKARDALSARGVTDETARVYRMGFAPDSWDSLIHHMGTKRISARDLDEVGLVLPRKSGDGFYDRFRNRLMFTISDATGRPIAYSGRRLNDEEDGAKYINSPTTPDYEKGKVLFGLNQARVGISKLDEVVVVEGNFDVISLYQAGFHNVVAPLGTALTEQQATLLRRRAAKVTLVFDGDNAGRAAAAKSFPMLARNGLASYTAPLPAGEDPDSLVRKSGPKALEQLLSRRKGLLDAIIERLAEHCDGTAQDKSRRIAKLSDLLESVRSAMEKDIYQQKIAERFAVDTRTVFKYLRGAKVSAEEEQRPVKSWSALPGRMEERELLGLLLDRPEFFDQTLADGTLSLLTTPGLKKMADELARRWREKESLVADLMIGDEADNLITWFASRAMMCQYQEGEADRASKALKEIRVKLSKYHTARQIEKIDRQIQEANAAGDEMLVLELSRKKHEVQKELHGLGIGP